MSAETEFDRMTDPIRAEMPDALTEAVRQQADVVATYFLHLTGKGLSAKNALALTMEWMNLANREEDEDED